MGSSKPPKNSNVHGDNDDNPTCTTFMHGQTDTEITARARRHLRSRLYSIHNISQYNHTTLNQKEPCNCRIT